MAESLKSRTINGIVWSGVEKFGNQGAQFILGIILARLLTPSDYGLVGMLAIFIAISQTLIDSGFNSALIRTKNPVPQDFSTVFWFNFGISFLLYLILYITSPWIADFYKQEELKNLTRVIALVLIINALYIVQRTILTKNIDFKSQMKITMSSTILGGFLGIVFAYMGYGVWALVIQTLSRSIISAIGFWLNNKWLPGSNFSKESFNRLFGFGYKVMLSSLLNTFFINIYTLIIGKIFNAESLGYYTRADQFKRLPINSTYSIIQRVSYPVLSELQDDHTRLVNAYKKFIKYIGYLIFPIMGFMGVLAYPVIEVLLGEKWMSSAQYLQILVISGAMYPISAINLNVLNVKGRSDLFLKLEIIKKVLLSIMIVITIPFGIIVLLWGQVVLSVISLVINTYYTKRLIDYGLPDQLKDLFLPFLLTIISIAGIYLIHFFIGNSLIFLVVGSLFGLSIYSFLFYFNAKEERMMIINLIKHRK